MTAISMIPQAVGQFSILNRLKKLMYTVRVETTSIDIYTTGYCLRQNDTGATISYPTSDIHTYRTSDMISDIRVPISNV